MIDFEVKFNFVGEENNLNISSSVQLAHDQSNMVEYEKTWPNLCMSALVFFTTDSYETSLVYILCQRQTHK